MSERSDQANDKLDKMNESDLSNNESDSSLSENEAEVKTLKTKMLPACIMLLGGAVTSVVCFINHYSLKDMSIFVLCSLVVFLILGFLLKKLFDSFKLVDNPRKKKEKEAKDEGEVIQKDVPPAS